MERDDCKRAGAILATERDDSVRIYRIFLKRNEPERLASLRLGFEIEYVTVPID